MSEPRKRYMDVAVSTPSSSVIAASTSTDLPPCCVETLVTRMSAPVLYSTCSLALRSNVAAKLAANTPNPAVRIRRREMRE